METEVFKEAFHIIPTELYAFAADTLRFSHVNTCAQQNLQYPISKLMEMSPIDIKPEFNEISFRTLLKQAGRHRSEDINFTTKHLRKDGTQYDAHVTLRYIEGSNPHYLAVVHEVSSQMETEADAISMMGKLNTAIEALPDGFALFDENDRLVICNSKFRELYTPSIPAIIRGTSFKSILRYGLKQGQYVEAYGREEEWLHERLEMHSRADSVVEHRMADGRWLRILERKTSDGGRVGLRIDITELKEKQLELERTALTDSLTGLANRHGLSAFLAGAPAMLVPDERLALFHIDLDKFKAINDAIGHDAGDFVLRNVSQGLSAKVTADDRVVIARVGGDEFVVAMATTMGDAEMHAFAEDLRIALTDPVIFDGRLCQVGASIGISFWSHEAPISMEQALLDADTALLQAKGLGRNICLLFKKEMRNQAVSAAHIASEIKEGLKWGDFVPFFQPQVELPSGRVRGLEALARWRHSDGTHWSASAFMDIAKEAGLGSSLDREMIEKSLDAFKRLEETGIPTQRLSLNMSSSHLRDPFLVDQLCQDVETRGLETSMVALEILESTLLDDRCSSISVNIHALAEAGFRIELDDFGTGHTAIASLREFPVHQIKIDRSLIRSIDTNPDVLAITEGIFNLCRKLGVEALAEGVETEHEAKTLVEIGFEVFQGFYFAHPMSEWDLCNWFVNRADIRTRTATDILANA